MKNRPQKRPNWELHEFYMKIKLTLPLQMSVQVRSTWNPADGVENWVCTLGHIAETWTSEAKPHLLTYVLCSESHTLPSKFIHIKNDLDILLCIDLTSSGFRGNTMHHMATKCTNLSLRSKTNKEGNNWIKKTFYGMTSVF